MADLIPEPEAHLRTRVSLLSGETNGVVGGEPVPPKSLRLIRGTPRPFSYMPPRLDCAAACPWSAASRNHRTASSHPPDAEAPPIHDPEVVLRDRVSLLGGETNGRDGVRRLCLILIWVQQTMQATDVMETLDLPFGALRTRIRGQHRQRPTISPRVSANGAAHLVVSLIMVTVTGILRGVCRQVNGFLSVGILASTLGVPTTPGGPRTRDLGPGHSGGQRLFDT